MYKVYVEGFRVLVFDRVQGLGSRSGLLEHLGWKVSDKFSHGRL